MTVKGQEFPAYDPRAIQGMGLGYATSNRGACHLRAYTISAEMLGVGDAEGPAGPVSWNTGTQIGLNAREWLVQAGVRRGDQRFVALTAYTAWRPEPDYRSTTGVLGLGTTLGPTRWELSAGGGRDTLGTLVVAGSGLEVPTGDRSAWTVRGELVGGRMFRAGLLSGWLTRF